ncbi:hypothetical protein BLNAU_9864 [Blattamonas nauphoetae]|uniref:Uncharacterized protein n=1 Tax=Blattamonas nauphoetae TaxID=2049346 RepID=A0ABQ9XUH7_9EUKA|nr:hypothetical protein BLNAU_9864 [Blattamonas nauphoetae]
MVTREGFGMLFVMFDFRARFQREPKSLSKGECELQANRGDSVDSNDGEVAGGGLKDSNDVEKMQKHDFGAEKGRRRIVEGDEEERVFVGRVLVKSEIQCVPKEGQGAFGKQINTCQTIKVVVHQKSLGRTTTVR